MRRGGPLVAIALVAGCLQPHSTQCPGGWSCPEGYECTTAAPYCATAERIRQCNGAMPWTGCQFSDSEKGSCELGACEACTVDREGCHFPDWTAMTSTSSAALHAVWAQGLASAAAVGAAPDGALVYDGTAWQPITPPSLAQGVYLSGLVGQPDGSFLVTATSGTVYDLTGGTFSSVFDAGVALHGIWSSSSGLVMAAGNNGEVARRTGTTWTTEAAVAMPVQLNAIWGTPDGSDIFVAGACGAIYRYHASAWSQSRAPSCTGQTALEALWGTDASHVYAAGLAGTGPTLLVFDGSQWSPVSLPVAITAGVGDLFGIWGTSATDLRVVGHAGLVLHLQGDPMSPASWSATNVPSGADLFAITGNGSGDIFAVGATGALWRYSP